MNLAVTILVIMLSGMFLWGYTELEASQREEQAVHAMIDGVSDLQTSFYRWVNGCRHREDGPAIEYADGTPRWYLHGKELSPWKARKLRAELARTNGGVGR